MPSSTLHKLKHTAHAFFVSTTPSLPPSLSLWARDGRTPRSLAFFDIVMPLISPFHAISGDLTEPVGCKEERRGERGLWSSIKQSSLSRPTQNLNNQEITLQCTGHIGCCDTTFTNVTLANRHFEGTIFLFWCATFAGPPRTGISCNLSQYRLG